MIKGSLSSTDVSRRRTNAHKNNATPPGPHRCVASTTGYHDCVPDWARLRFAVCQSDAHDGLLQQLEATLL
jgi:hypothetical protein